MPAPRLLACPARLHTLLSCLPSPPSAVEALFQAFCQGAERNPDNEPGGGDDEDSHGGGAFFYDEDEVLAGAAAAIAVEDVDELVGNDPDRFGDAEDEEDDYEEEEGEEQPAAAGQQNGHHA